MQTVALYLCYIQYVCNIWYFSGQIRTISPKNFAALFNCTSASHDGSGLKTNMLSWSELDYLSLVGLAGVQLLDFCCSSVSVFVLLLSAHFVSSEYWILIYMFVVLIPWWVGGPWWAPGSLYVYEPQRNKGKGCDDVQLRIALWPSARKELVSWLSAYAVSLNALLIICVSIPFDVLARMYTSIVSVLDHCPFLYFGCACCLISFGSYD